MKALLVIMTGIGFTLGVVFGLLLHLPSDSLPAQHAELQQQDVRAKRQAAGNDAFPGNYEIKSHYAHLGKGFRQTNNNVQSVQMPDWNLQPGIKLSSRKGHANKEHFENPKVNSKDERKFRKSGQRSLSLSKQTRRHKLDKSLSEVAETKENGNFANPVFSQGLESEKKAKKTDPKDPSVNRLTASQSAKGEGLKMSNSSGELRHGGHHKNMEGLASLEDQLYISSIVNNVYWSEKAENACRKPFTSTDIDLWRTKVQGLDVVKMETGCGRMQNRLLTFRDSSKACARYRLNTDQIQGDIFSYYLAKLLNIPNLPPTILAAVNSVDQKWRTVHLDLSLAQWADSKLVVLTKFIEGLKPAHIPKEFRDEHRQLFPILKHLGTKSQTELCELMQWSDLIIFDYLTANLDRVINNMFNSQWNDQMMSSPTHNLEKFPDGGLVFLDNESGLFHGFRLIDKYEKLHRALLDSVCVFRSSTADVIKRLANSGSVGKELRDLLESNEPLARLVPSMPSKNVKILERRLQQVYKQIVKCEKDFNR